MSKYEEASLVLKLYELRREDVMRKARDWFFREFNPESLADFTAVTFSEHGGYLRMVSSYWDMAAAFVNSGAISVGLFSETCPEAFAIFSRLEPILAEIRAAYDPQFLANLEAAMDKIPEGRARGAAARERMKSFRSQTLTSASK